MKTIKKTILVIILLIAVVWCYTLISGYVIIIPLTKPEPTKIIQPQNGDIINPLNSFDFNKGKWVVYLVISRNDYADLPSTIIKAKCLKVEDISILKQMQNEWNFVYTGGDIATVESEIYFFNNEKLVFKSGIILGKNIIGLQNRSYGYLESKDSPSIIKHLKSFKKVYSPIIFL